MHCWGLGGGWAIAHPGFGKSVNPITTRGGRLCPLHSTTYPPSFWWLPTPLLITLMWITIVHFTGHILVCLINTRYRWSVASKALLKNIIPHGEELNYIFLNFLCCILLHFLMYYVSCSPDPTNNSETTNPNFHDCNILDKQVLIVNTYVMFFFHKEKRVVSELIVRSGRNSVDALPNLFSCFFFAQQMFLLIYIFREKDCIFVRHLFSFSVSWKKVCFLSIEYFSIFPLKVLSGLCLLPAMLSLLQKKVA